MANTAAVYARIEPELKNEVEGILSQLGITPSALVQMLYSQIKLTKRIPFEIKLPAHKLLSIDELTTEQLNAELQKGLDDVKAGRLHSADEVDSILHWEYGI